MGRVAVVSGGSRGIGAATVLRLAQEGWDVSFCYRSDGLAALEVEKSAAEQGVRVMSSCVDVASALEVKEWLDRTEDELGAVEAAVACAGVVRDRPLALMSEADWHQVMGTNLDGVFHLCRAVTSAMVKRRVGMIVTVSSVSGVCGSAGQVNYAASKAGVIGFTKALAKEVGRYGVRANVVAPGLIETDMTAELTEKARTLLLNAVSMSRFGTAGEVADAVAFLVSDRAAYVTGSVLEVHGGISL